PVMKTDPRFMTVPNRFAQLAADEQPLTIHAGATRPAGFIHVDDASAALRTVLGADWAEPYRAVNAVAECLTVREVAECIRSAAHERGLRSAIIGPAPRNHAEVVVRSSLSSVGFRPRRRLAESVGEVIDHFRPAPS